MEKDEPLWDDDKKETKTGGQNRRERKNKL